MGRVPFRDAVGALCCGGSFCAPVPARGAQVPDAIVSSWRCPPAVAAAAWAAATAGRSFLFELSYERGGLLRP
jgi:hypothetical protein